MLFWDILCDNSGVTSAVDIEELFSWVWVFASSTNVGYRAWVEYCITPSFYKSIPFNTIKIRTCIRKRGVIPFQGPMQSIFSRNAIYILEVVKNLFTRSKIKINNLTGYLTSFLILSIPIRRNFLKKLCYFRGKTTLLPLNLVDLQIKSLFST